MVGSLKLEYIYYEILFSLKSETTWMKLVEHCVHAKSLQSCLTLCNPMDHSPQGSFVHGILQARVPECSLPCILPGDLSNPRIEPTSLRSPALAGGFFTTSATWEASNTTGLFSLKKQGSPATRYSMDEPQRRSK